MLIPDLSVNVIEILSNKKYCVLFNNSSYPCCKNNLFISLKGLSSQTVFFSYF